MRTLKRALLVLAVLIVLLVALAVIGMRASIGRFTGPDLVEPDFSEVVSGARMYATHSGPKVVVFDAGVDPKGRGVDPLLAAIHATRADVSDVFLTHGHADHIAAAPLFPGARVHAGAGDVGLAATGEPVESRGARLMGAIMGRSRRPRVEVTDPLHGIFDVTLPGGDAVKALPMPGHTPGSYAYLYRGVLIVGDAMNWNGHALEEVPSFFEAHPAEARAAVVALAEPLQNLRIDRVCTAHGGCTPPGRGRAEFDAYVARLRAAGVKPPPKS